MSIYSFFSTFISSPNGSSKTLVRRAKSAALWVGVVWLSGTGLAITGCSEPSFSNPEALQAYLVSDDSPFVQRKEQGGVNFSLRYIPTEGLMLSDYRRVARERAMIASDTSFSETERTLRYDALVREVVQTAEDYDASFHFVLSVIPGSSDLVYSSLAGGHDAYSAWLQKLLFGLGEVISIRVPRLEPIPPETYHMERTYGAGRERSFFLTFPSTVQGRDLRTSESLRVHLGEFGLGTGAVNFAFSLPLPEVHYTAPR